MFFVQKKIPILSQNQNQCRKLQRRKTRRSLCQTTSGAGAPTGGNGGADGEWRRISSYARLTTSEVATTSTRRRFPSHWSFSASANRTTTKKGNQSLTTTTMFSKTMLNLMHGEPLESWRRSTCFNNNNNVLKDNVESNARRTSRIMKKKHMLFEDSDDASPAWKKALKQGDMLELLKMVLKTEAEKKKSKKKKTDNYFF